MKNALSNAPIARTTTALPSFLTEQATRPALSMRAVSVKRRHLKGASHVNAPNRQLLMAVVT